MMLTDRRADVAARERLLASIETAVTHIRNTASAKNDVEKVFLDVLLTEPDVIGTPSAHNRSTRWHLKIGLIITALASRGFEVSRRDVENMRDRLQRNVDLRSVITLKAYAFASGSISILSVTG